MYEKLCEKLKKKREALGFDIEEVVERTKLHPSVIKAIENGNLEDISPIYIKGFIKIYASFLGVSIEEDLNTIFQKKDNLKKVRKEEEKNVRTSMRRSFQLTFPPQFKKYLLRGIYLIIIVVFAFFLIAGIVRGIKRIFLQKKSSTPFVYQGESEETKQIASFSQEATRNALSVALRVKKNCFVRVKLDGTVVFEGVLPGGTIETWKAKEQLEFKISDGSSVDIEVNGDMLPPISKIRRPIKSLKITPQGVTIEK